MVVQHRKKAQRPLANDAGVEISRGPKDYDKIKKDLAAAGYWGLLVDPQYGGQGAPFSAFAPFLTRMATVDATVAELRSRGVEVLGDAIDLEAINRRLGFLKDNNDNIIELASPLR